MARDPQGHLAAIQRDGDKAEAANTSTANPAALNVSLETDIPSYYPGQEINFRALLQPTPPERVWSSPILGKAVSVALLSPEGLVLSVLNLKPDSVGGVSGSFNLAEGIQPGQYTHSGEFR